MQLFYDARDVAAHEARRSRILDWLDDLGAKSLSDARPDDEGFLFAGARAIDDYEQLVAQFPLLHDRAAERAPLLRLDFALDALSQAGIDVPTPPTWRLPLDAPLPSDISFPLFVRTAASSLKLGGGVSRVRSRKQLESEAAELRRLLGWDSLILARAWCDFAPAGEGMRGPIPQEIRVWIVDGAPFAWSFHYLNLLPEPAGFPPARADLECLREMARRVGSAFRSRCMVADFARLESGSWIFIEAGPGSCAGTAHEGVFKAVASRLLGVHATVPQGGTGGLFV